MNTVIGESHVRRDGYAKLRGTAVYATDVEVPRMLHAKVLRSPVPSARIRRLDIAPAVALSGVHAVVTGDDAPFRSGWIVKDQTLFARGVVRHVGEPIAAVAADSEAVARQALTAILVELDDEPALLDPMDALAENAPLVHPEWEGYATLMPGPRSGNVAWETTLERGDVDAAFERDDVILVEDEFRVPRQHQAYLEQRAVVASYDGERWTIIASTQFPFLVRDRVAEFMGVSPSRVRVKTTAVGGGFGGKIDANPEPIAALLAKETRRPVRLAYTRREEFLAATPRENAIIRLRSAVTADGQLVAQEADVIADNGCYSGETPATGSASGLLLTLAYRIANVRIRARVVYTNTPPTGAFRGVGGTYLVFASERHLDNIAATIGVDRRELRLRNVYRPGDTYASGQPHEAAEAFADAFARIDSVAPWAELSRRRPYRGVGIAAISWITNPMPGGAVLKLNEDGTVGLITAAAECGTGAVAAGLVQVVSEELGLPPENVVVADNDTDMAPWDGGAQGSRTLFNVGNAIRLAASEVRTQVFESAAELLEASEQDLELVDGYVQVVGSPGKRLSLATVAQSALFSGGPITGKGRYAPPPLHFDAACFTGAMLGTLNAATYHVHLAEVEVDPGTGKITVVRYVVAQDVGKAINPALIRGQVQGAVAQGVGYALLENVRLEDGVPLERDLKSYRLPTALDVPKVELILLEYPSPHGPYGAKGAAEPAIVPVAAVIANAVSDAIGQPISSLPIAPFTVLELLRRQSAQRP